MILPGWIRVYITLLGAGGVDDKSNKVGIPAHQLYRRYSVGVARTLRKQNYRRPGKELMQKGATYTEYIRESIISQENPFTDFMEFISQVLGIIKPMRLLLMIDEYDLLQEGMESGITGVDVVENHRSIMMRENLGVIISGLGADHRRRKYADLLYSISDNSIYLEPLTEGAARELVECAFSHYSVGPDDDVIKYIADICDNQPYLIEGLCIEILNASKRKQMNLIDQDYVTESACEFAVRSPFLELIWSQLGSLQRDLCRALISGLPNSGGDFSRSNAVKTDKLIRDITTLSQHYGIDEIMAALDSLGDLQLVGHSNDKGHYFLCLPLMALWMRGKRYSDPAHEIKE
jgi:type I restriction enzyme M protein